MTVNDLVGRNVAQLREALGFSQRQVVALLQANLGVGLNPASLARIETGERRITVDDVFAISVVLGVSPVDLLLPRSPRGTTAISETVELPHRQLRPWVRGHRALGAPWPDNRDAVQLEDVKLEQRAKELLEREEVLARNEFVHQKELSRDRDELEHLRQERASSNQDLSEAIERLEFQIEMRRRALERATRELERTRQAYRQVHAELVQAGWWEATDVEDHFPVHTFEVEFKRRESIEASPPSDGSDLAQERA